MTQPTTKIDFKKTVPTYKAPHGRFEIVTVAPTQYLMIDGHGDPNDPDGEYAAALATLYPVAYTLKFFSKNELGRDYVVMPLEALWWADDMALFTAARDKSTWDWTAMLMTPDWITSDHYDDARATVERKGTGPALSKIRLATLDEGLVVQTLHIGSYDDEAPVLAALHDEFIPANNLAMTGRHHEVYLSDPRRVKPAKLKTILRQPVRASSNAT